MLNDRVVRPVIDRLNSRIAIWDYGGIKTRIQCGYFTIKDVILKEGPEIVIVEGFELLDLLEEGDEE